MPSSGLESDHSRLHRGQRPTWPPGGRPPPAGDGQSRANATRSGSRVVQRRNARRSRRRRERPWQPPHRPSLPGRAARARRRAAACARRSCHDGRNHRRASGRAGGTLAHADMRAAAAGAGNHLRVKPLEGITVLALEQVIAAPFATRQLAELGARVIKIERPGSGDAARAYDQTVMGQSSHFVWTNRSKQSFSLDLKHAQAPVILEKLTACADVFVQNLAPGAAERLGLGAATLRARHPRLIWCGISGYGPSGPYAEKKAYDLLVQCEVGLLSVTGTPETPSKAGIPVADIAAGMYAFSSILAALLRRERSGEGATLDITMFESLGEWMGFPAYFTAYGGAPPPRSGAHHATIAPYGPFATGDGGRIFLSVQNEREFARFCETVLGRPELAGDEIGRAHV